VTNLIYSFVFLIRKRVEAKLIRVDTAEIRGDMRDIRKFTNMLSFIGALWTKLDETVMEI